MLVRSALSRTLDCSLLPLLLLSIDHLLRKNVCVANLLPRTKKDLAKVLSVEATTNDNKLEGRTTFAKYNAFHCFEFSETNGKIQFSVAFSKDIIGEENGSVSSALSLSALKLL